MKYNFPRYTTNIIIPLASEHRSVVETFFRKSSIVILTAVFFVNTGLDSSVKGASEPKSVYLDTQEELEVHALSHYLWGYYLSLDRDSRWEHVNEEYIAAIQRDPDSEFLISEITDLWSRYYRKSEAKAVINYLSEIAEQNPQSTLINLFVANAYLNEQDYKSAEAILSRLFTRVKWTEPLLIGPLAECYFRTGNILKADKLFRKASKSRHLRHNFNVALSGALFYGEVGFSETYELSPRRRRKFQRLAYEHGLKAKDALSVVDNAIYPDEELMALIGLLLRGNFIKEATYVLSSLRNNGTGNFDTNKLLAECYEGLNQPQEAMNIWKELSDTFPFNPFYHFKMGLNLKTLGRYKDALLALQTAFRLKNSPTLAYEIITVCLSLELPSKAVEYVDHLSNDNLDTYIIRSFVLRQLGKTEEALHTLRQAQHAIEGSDEDLVSDYYLSLATIYNSLHYKKETIDTLEKGLELSPDSAELNNFLGYYLADQGQELDRAEALIQNAIKANPKNPAYIDSLAWVLFRKGEYRKAANQIDRALQLNEEDFNGVILDHAGDIFIKIGNVSKAITYWELAIQHNIDEKDKVRQKILQAEKLYGGVGD